MKCKCGGHIGCTTCDCQESRVEWISVKDSLPEDDQAVLMYDDGQDCRLPILGWYQADDFAPGFYDANLSTRLVVSHWMDCPEPPKKEEE